MPVNPKNLTLEMLREWFESQGIPKFRAVQVFEWIFKHRVTEYRQMTNLPAELRSYLEENAPLWLPEAVRGQESKVDGTRKLLLRLSDGQHIETVLIPHDYGNSVCISSQVGCALACSFCATGISGFIRHLEVAEMVDQALAFGTPISSVVMMGMGEPLLNLGRVLDFLAILHEPQGLNIGYRHMTISTAGIPEGIQKLADSALQITLAISLHAPNNQLRSELMPINRKYPMEQVLAAADYHADRTGRRYSLEYALISQVNDAPEQARELARALRGKLCHVNLIPLNKVSEKQFERSGTKNVETFLKVLESAGIPATVRREMGSDIDAACGQLRSRVAGEARSD